MGMLLIVVTLKEQRMHLTQTICANMVLTRIVSDYVILPSSVFLEYSYWLLRKRTALNIPPSFT